MATAVSESSPLLSQSNSDASRGSNTSRMPSTGARTQRTVTFNPLTTISTHSGSAAPGPSLRPMQTPSSTLTTGPPNSNAAQSSREPILSAFNSKLRRRNSAGAPLPTARTSAPLLGRPGAQRTTKTTQKLKILPNPETDEDGGDEESGRDVYSQFTRIKDPNARRDAARLGKADRERLPRVTAYCVAQGYRLEGIMKFMKGRAKTRGANPKLLDECIYSPYNYEYAKKLKEEEEEMALRQAERQAERRNSKLSHTERTSSRSPIQERRAKVLASPRMTNNERRYSDSAVQEEENIRRFSDSAVEVEDNMRHRREDLIDLQEELGQPAMDPDNFLNTGMEDATLEPLMSHSSTDLVGHREQDELYERSNSELSTEVHTPEVFVFDYGTIVIWGMTEVQEQRFLRDITKFSEGPLPTESVQTENFNFYYTKEYQARIYNDFISLRDPKHYMTKLAISHALAQSVKTSLFEDLVSETIETTSPLPALIAQTGSANLTATQLNMQIGELFILRINIHLQGSVLDSPELMWSEPQLEPVYAAVRSYLEIGQRVELLNERLDVIADLLAVLREQGSRRHGEVLEWIVIVLIAAEILVAAVNIVVDLVAGAD